MEPKHCEERRIFKMRWNLWLFLKTFFFHLNPYIIIFPLGLNLRYSGMWRLYLHAAKGTGRVDIFLVLLTHPNSFFRFFLLQVKPMSIILEHAQQLQHAHPASSVWNSSVHNYTRFRSYEYKIKSYPTQINLGNLIAHSETFIKDKQRINKVALALLIIVLEYSRRRDQSIRHAI